MRRTRMLGNPGWSTAAPIAAACLVSGEMTGPQRSTATVKRPGSPQNAEDNMERSLTGRDASVPSFYGGGNGQPAGCEVPRSKMLKPHTWAKKVSCTARRRSILCLTSYGALESGHCHQPIRNPSTAPSGVAAARQNRLRPCSMLSLIETFFRLRHHTTMHSP